MTTLPPLTASEIEELRRLEAAATPGPWLVNPFEAIVDPANALYEDGTPIAVCKMLWPTEYRSEDETFANAELIAAARNTLPRLIATVEQLQKDRGDVSRIINASINIGSWLSAALEDDNVCEEMKDDIKEWFEATDTDIPAPDEWRCFHCDMRFTDKEEAKKHFGEFSAIPPACVEFFKENGSINLVQKCVDLGKQLATLRQQLAELEAEVERLKSERNY